MNTDEVAAQERLPLRNARFVTEAASFRRVDHHLFVVRLDIEDLFGQQADGLSVGYETDGFLGGGEAFLQITRQRPVSDEQQCQDEGNKDGIEKCIGEQLALYETVESARVFSLPQDIQVRCQDQGRFEDQNGELSAFMKKLNERYAMYFRKVTGRVGHVFQGRFWNEAIETDEYYLTALRYKLSSAKKWTAKKMAGTKASWTSGKLTKGKTYQVQVRAYDKQTKSWGAWSAAAKVKIKK